LQQTYKFDTTQNRILVDVVIVQQVVEYELTSYQKQKSVRNYIMGAIVPANDMPVLEEMVRDCNNNNGNNGNDDSNNNLTLSEYSRDGFIRTTKQFDIKAIPTNPHERSKWLDIVNEKFPERLTLREYGYFERNGDVIAENLVAKMPDTLDRYNPYPNTHIPGEYGSIYVYKDDFRPLHTHEKIMQWQQEATNFLERQRLIEQLQLEKKRKEKEAFEKIEKEEMHRKAAEAIKNLRGPKEVIREQEEREKEYQNAF
jgi:hypothetical protein